MRVKDGETVAIGGLTLNQEQTTNSKIPLLGDLPIIGSLFRSKKRNVVQTELVVFVTPRILPPSVTGAADLPTAPNGSATTAPEGSPAPPPPVVPK